MQFRSATREESHLRLCLTGPAGAGKTFSALRIGTAIANGDRIAVIDTERRSSCKYASADNPDGGTFDFDVLHLDPPYHPDRYAEAIKAAVGAGYGVQIIDSISHEWNGPGGILEQVDRIASTKYRGNSFAAWKDATPLHQSFVDALLATDVHLIVTARSKTEYVLDEGKGGKKGPQKVGMAAVQREGIEYEFDVVLDMDVEHVANVSKTRCPGLTDKRFRNPGADVAEILRDWLSPGSVEPEAMDESQFAAHVRRACQNGGIMRRAFVDRWGMPDGVAPTDRVAALAWAASGGDPLPSAASAEPVMDEEQAPPPSTVGTPPAEEVAPDAQ